MGHRRNNGRSAANSVPGRHNSGRRNSIGASQTSMTNRMRNNGPMPRYSPACCSSQTSRRISMVNESSHRSCMLKQERGIRSPRHSCSEQIPTWIESSSSSSNCSISSCSISTFGFTGNASDSNGGGGGSSSSRKGERPISSRPSNPLRYKTELCRSFEESGDCRFGIACTFAHGLTELRAVHRHPLYKTDLCRTYHSLGYCQYGARCHFVHDPEEAAGASRMRGHKVRSSYDRLGSTMLALAENSGITSDPSTSDVLLANLRRLYAVRTLEEQSYLPDASSSSQLGDEGPNFISLLSDGSVLQSKNVSSISSADPSPSKPSVSGSYIDSSLCDTSQDNLLETSMNGSMDINEDTGIWSTTSTPTLENSWWGAFSNITPLSPDPESTTKPFLSLFPIGHEMRETASGLQFQTVISNPMEVSRSLQLPSIAELCHI